MHIQEYTPIFNTKKNTIFYMRLRIYFFQSKQKPHGARDCFHPGASELAPNTVKLLEQNVTGWMVIRSMLKYVWPKDRPSHRVRVLVALGLLVGAKVQTLNYFTMQKHLLKLQFSL